MSYFVSKIGNLSYILQSYILCYTRGPDAHDPPASGNLGVDKTLDRIRTAYYFPKMAIKVKLQLGKCLVCHNKSRNQNKLKAPLTPFSGTAPGEIV